MKRIIKESSRVFEIFVNVREKTLRVVEYGDWYVAYGEKHLKDEELRSLITDPDHDIKPIIQGIYGRFIGRRNPYFSSKTGKPLSKWFEI